MHISKLFGENIRFLRKAAGIASRGNGFSQQEIADMLGVSRKTIVFWESGQIPSPKKLALLCELFTRRLSLGEPLTPEDLLDKNIADYFILIPERAEVKQVKPNQKEMLNKIFMRASNLTENDLEKILEIIDKFSK